MNAIDIEQYSIRRMIRTLTRYLYDPKTFSLEYVECHGIQQENTKIALSKR